MVLLSVIIPTYNSEEVIERCLISLAYQTFDDFEVCIIDGGSIDQTIAKANNFSSQIKNIKITSEPDQGAYDAMNKGITTAQGDWLYFLGSDDEVCDEKVFSDIFESLNLKKIEIVYGNACVKGNTVWAKDGQAYDGFFDLRKLLSKNICHQAIFYKKDLFKRFGNYKTRYPICADWEINLRFFPKTESLYTDRLIANFYGGGLSSKQVFDPIENDLEKLRNQAIREYNFRRITSLFRFPNKGFNRSHP